jgi:hypothetical protein
MKPDFEMMSRQELRQYILEHREDEQAFYAYMDRLNREPNKPVFPAPKSIEDLSNFAQLLEQYGRRQQE